MRRKYQLSIWYSEDQRTDSIEFESDSIDEARIEAIKIYRDKKLDNNCFLFVWIPKGDPQFVSKYHNSWKCISYFPAACKDIFLDVNYLKRR